MNSGHRKFQKFCVLFCFNCLLNSRKGLRCNPLSISSAGFHNICFNLYSDFTFRCLALLNTDTGPRVGSHSLPCRMLHTVSSDTEDGAMPTGDHWWGHVPVFPRPRCPRDWVRDHWQCAGHLYRPPVHLYTSNIGTMVIMVQVP